MSSAICFSFDQSKNLSSGNGLKLCPLVKTLTSQQLRYFEIEKNVKKMYKTYLLKTGTDFEYFCNPLSSNPDP